MSKTVLAVDVSNMAYRALYSTGDLSYQDMATGVLYGMFRDVVEWWDLFQPDMIAWCFDGGYDGRKSILPEYKANRRKHRVGEEEQQTRRDMRRQLYRLRTELLDQAGFRNVLWQEGYEADDVIAWVCESHTHDFVVASTDQDLFQCLNDRVVLWNPITKRPTTAQSFEQEYGIPPSKWTHAKAVAGDAGDNIPGVPGVGIKTAIKFLKGDLGAKTKARKEIIMNGDVVMRNQRLVELPFEGCGPFELNDDDVTPSRWDSVMESLGMRSLVGRR